MKLVRIAALALARSRQFRHGGGRAQMERLERRSLQPRRRREALRDSRSRGGVVSLVPRHGKTTYANPEVQELLASKYLPVRVDQDANPDLSSRYGDWGWPATIVFGPMAPRSPRSGIYRTGSGCRPCSTPSSTIPRPGLRSARPLRSNHPPRRPQQASARRTNKNFDESYEDKLGGWGENQKYIDADSMDLAITRAEAG